VTALAWDPLTRPGHEAPHMHLCRSSNAPPREPKPTGPGEPSSATEAPESNPLARLPSEEVGPNRLSAAFLAPLTFHSRAHPTAWPPEPYTAKEAVTLRREHQHFWGFYLLDTLAVSRSLRPELMNSPEGLALVSDRRPSPRVFANSP